MRQLRSRLPGVATCATVVALGTSCARLPANGGLAEVNTAIGARTGLTASWIQGSAEDSVAAAYASRALRGEVPVDTAIRVALLRNKRLQATFEELGIARADVIQAGLIANPLVSAGRLTAADGGTGITQLGLALPFVDLLQRSGRTSVASSRFSAEQARVADAVLALVADVRVAYASAQAAAQMEEFRATVLQATEASATAAAAMRAAGNIAEYDLAQHQALAADARIAWLAAQGEQRVARSELARVMGVSSDTAWRVAMRMADPVDGVPDVATLGAIAHARRLDLTAAYHDAEAAGRAAGVARTFALLPDGTIGVARDADPDGRFTGGTIAIPIPLFDQGQGRVARARAEFRRAVNRHDALVTDVGAEVQQLAARLTAARARVVHLQTTVLPLRRRVVEESQKFVNANEHSVFTLLLAKQAEIDAGQSYVEALRDYWVARARLEQAVGGSFRPLATDERAPDVRRER